MTTLKKCYYIFNERKSLIYFDCAPSHLVISLYKVYEEYSLVITGSCFVALFIDTIFTRIADPRANLLRVSL